MRNTNILRVYCNDAIVAQTGSNFNPVVFSVQHAGIFHLTTYSHFSPVYRLHSQEVVKIRMYYIQHATRMQLVCFAYLQPNLLIHSDRPVAEGDGVTEASLSLDGPLGHVHDNLRALGTGVKEQREGGQTPTWLDGQAALGLVVASVGCGRKRPVQRIYVEKEKWLLKFDLQVGSRKYITE